MTQGITKHSDYMKAIPQKAIDVQGQIAPNIEFKKPYDYQPNTAQMIHYYANELSYLGGDPVPPLSDPSLLPHAPVVESIELNPFSINVSPMVSGDDGFIDTEGSIITYQNLRMGKISSTIQYSTYIRFPLVNIEKGSIINSAVLTLTGDYTTGSGTCNMTIYANYIDNAIAPITAAQYNAFLVTAASIIWDNVQSVADVIYTTPDISKIIQEVVNRAGWKAKNALMLLIKNNGSNNYRQFASFDHGGQNPNLKITGN